MFRFKVKAKDAKGKRVDISFVAIFKTEQRKRLTKGQFEDIDVTTCMFNRASDQHPIGMGFSVRRFDDPFSQDNAYRVAFGRAAKDFSRIFEDKDAKDVRQILLDQYNKAAA